MVGASDDGSAPICTLPADSGEDATSKDKDCAAINAIFRGLSVH